MPGYAVGRKGLPEQVTRVPSQVDAIRAWAGIGADPAATGVMEGETLDQSDAVLPRVYLATIQGLAYMTRHIVDQMRAQGLRVDTVSACGGAVKSAIYLQV